MLEAILRFANIRVALGYRAVRVGHRTASERGCRTHVGAEMLFGHVLLYLGCFGFGAVNPDALRSVAAPGN